MPEIRGRVIVQHHKQQDAYLLFDRKLPKEEQERVQRAVEAVWAEHGMTIRSWQDGSTGWLEVIPYYQLPNQATVLEASLYRILKELGYENGTI